MKSLSLAPPLLLAFAAPALAHPHVFVDAQAHVVVNAAKEVESVRVEWLFDENYSLYAKDGLALDADRDGLLDEVDRATLVEVHTDGMGELGWFTFLRQAGAMQTLAEPEDFEADMIGDRIVIRFTARPAAPLPISELDATLTLNDPTFFVAMTLRPEHFTFEGPEGCAALYEPDETQLSVTSLFGMDMSETAARSFGFTFATEAVLTCR